jgi:2-polyprenyl-3-methyl-5-hydroxy-6-metoxy-1,4-benzoquinol methylase
VDFSKRSYATELLDRDDIPFEDISRNMKELEFINAHLGGHKITISGFNQLLKTALKNKHSLVVAEIGCGGGDNLVAINKWCKKSGIALKCIGIDINPHCIEVAEKKLQPAAASFICSDYKLVNFGNEKPDIIFSSLFCHHFTNEELVSMLQWMQTHAGKGFFINDLQRHPVAYYAIKWLSSLFSRSYLVKNDAPLSVLRGFKKNEWKALLHSAGIAEYQLDWKWAFRYLLTVHKN